MTNKGWLVALGGLIAVLYATSAQANFSPGDAFAFLTTGLTRGERNNNPGNIKFSSGNNWQGQTGVDSSGFVIFDTAINGIRAIGKVLLSKFGRGLNTVASVISDYSQTDVSVYINNVANSLGVNPNDIINLNDSGTLFGFVLAIIQQENGRINYAMADIAKGVNNAIG